MNNKLLILILFIFSATTYASTSFMQATEHLVDTGMADKRGIQESWIKYTCHGPLTPMGISPIVHGDVVKFHYPVRRGGKYLSIREIQAQDSSRFEKMARICAVRRFAQTDLAGFTGNWLGWNTAYNDTKLSKREVIITNNLCREVGSPCATTSQCCRKKVAVLSPNVPIIMCNQDTHTCERDGQQE